MYFEMHILTLCAYKMKNNRTYIQPSTYLCEIIFIYFFSQLQQRPFIDFLIIKWGI